MADSIFLRVRRVLTASVDDAVTALERASGPSLLRETIRQVARAADEVRVEQEANAERIADARRQQAQIRERIAELEDKARYAMGKERDDLAGAAVARQLDLENELARLDQVRADAAERAVQLDECAAALVQRKAQMERELAAYEAAQQAEAPGIAAARRQRDLNERADRAQETFDRVMAMSGGAGAGRADAQEAEIDAMRREEAIEARLAAMRAEQARRAARPKRKAG